MPPRVRFGYTAEHAQRLEDLARRQREIVLAGLLRLARIQRAVAAAHPRGGGGAPSPPLARQSSEVMSPRPSTDGFTLPSDAFDLPRS